MTTAQQQRQSFRLSLSSRFSQAKQNVAQAVDCGEVKERKPQHATPPTALQKPTLLMRDVAFAQ